MSPVIGHHSALLHEIRSVYLCGDPLPGAELQIVEIHHPQKRISNALIQASGTH